MMESVHGTSVYGLILTGKDLEDFLEKAGNVLNIDPDSGEIAEAVSEEVFPNDEYAHYAYFDGEEDIADAACYFEGKTDRPGSDPVLVFTSDHEPDMFSAKYESIDAMADEFRKRYNRFMPEGFDYNGHLGNVIGTTFCD